MRSGVIWTSRCDLEDLLDGQRHAIALLDDEQCGDEVRQALIPEVISHRGDGVIVESCNIEHVAIDEREACRNGCGISGLSRR